MARFPEDRFDRLPDDLRRVGAHRRPRTRGRGWIGFLIALAAIVALTAGGLVMLQRVAGFDIDIPFLAAPTSTPTPTPTPTMPPVRDPAEIDQVAREIKIDVLNGTRHADIEAQVATQLRDLGWNVGVAVPAASDDVEKTFVYYDQAANEDVARGLVLAIGAGDIRLIDPGTFPGASLTIVLGDDFVNPVPEPAPSAEG